MFLRRASSRGRGAGERYMSLGVAVGRHGVCGGQAAVGGAHGEKQLGNGAFPHGKGAPVPFLHGTLGWRARLRCCRFCLACGASLACDAVVFAVGAAPRKGAPIPFLHGALGWCARIRCCRFCLACGASLYGTLGWRARLRCCRFCLACGASLACDASVRCCCA